MITLQILLMKQISLTLLIKQMIIIEILLFQIENMMMNVMLFIQKMEQMF